MRSRNDRFLDAIEEFTQACLDRPGGRRNEPAKRAAWRAVEDGVLSKRDGDLYEDLKRLRDSLAHVRHDGQTLFNVSPSAVRAAEGLREKICGSLPTVNSLKGDVETIGMGQTLAEACTIFREHDFTTLPVVGDDGLHGLLTATDVVWWVGGHLEDVGLLEDAPVADVVSAHTTVDYRLVSHDTPQRDVPPMFSQMTPSGCVLGAVLITSTGHAHEPLLGIITPWDLPSLAT